MIKARARALPRPSNSFKIKGNDVEKIDLTQDGIKIQTVFNEFRARAKRESLKIECGGWDSNPRTPKGEDIAHVPERS